MLGETPPEYRERLEWVTIPAVFEMVTETIIVQEAYPIVKVNPAHFAADGTLISKATAAIETVPALTKDVARRVVKTPARRVQRLIPNGYHAPTIRKRVAVETYIIRDETGAEIARYEDPVAFADFVNGL